MSQPDTLPAFFEGKSVRYVIVDGICYFSVVDVMSLLTEAEPRKYWFGVKRHILQREGYTGLFGPQK
jgi:hypothetical protein